MLSTKIRTAIVALVAACSFAAASVVLAVSQARMILASETCDRQGPGGEFEGSECEAKGYETEELPSGESEAKLGGEAPYETEVREKPETTKTHCTPYQVKHNLCE